MVHKRSLYSGRLGGAYADCVKAKLMFEVERSTAFINYCEATIANDMRTIAIAAEQIRLIQSHVEAQDKVKYVVVEVEKLMKTPKEDAKPEEDWKDKEAKKTAEEEQEDEEGSKTKTKELKEAAVSKMVEGVVKIVETKKFTDASKEVPMGPLHAECETFVSANTSGHGLRAEEVPLGPTRKLRHIEHASLRLKPQEKAEEKEGRRRSIQEVQKHAYS